MEVESEQQQAGAEGSRHSDSDVPLSFDISTSPTPSSSSEHAPALSASSDTSSRPASDHDVLPVRAHSALRYLRAKNAEPPGGDDERTKGRMQVRTRALNQLQ